MKITIKSNMKVCYDEKEITTVTAVSWCKYKGQEEERSVYRSRAWMEVPLYGQKILGFE